MAAPLLKASGPENLIDCGVTINDMDEKNPASPKTSRVGIRL
jgi:hypothetical protein